jgi:preprotein translocase subunit SecA
MSLLRRVLGSKFRYGKKLPIRKNIVLYEEDLERLKPFIEEQRKYLGNPEDFKPNFSAVIRRVIKYAYEQKMKEGEGKGVDEKD